MYNNMITDPYNSYYNDVFNNINELSDMVIKKINISNSDMNIRLKNINESLDILYETIETTIDDPIKFNLTKEIIIERKNQLDGLNKIYNDIVNHIDKKQMIHKIQQNYAITDIIENQDIKIDMLFDKLQNTKKCATLISTEIGDQEKLLNEVIDDTEQSTKVMKKYIEKLDNIIETAGSCKLIILIIIFVLILVGLIILIFSV